MIFLGRSFVSKEKITSGITLLQLAENSQDLAVI